MSASAEQSNDEKNRPEENFYESLSLVDSLSGLFRSEKYADIRFVVGKGKHQRVIGAHKIILASASHFFETMLYPTKFPGDPEVKESKSRVLSEDEIPEIEIPDVTPNAFKVLLECLYTDQATIEAEDLEDILHAAEKFQVETLKQLCAKWMEDGLSPQNACSLFVRADPLAEHHKKHFALRFIEDNTEDVIATPGWDELPEDRVITILQSDSLAIDEAELFKGCLRWALAQCRRKGLESNSENRNECLKPLVPYIRFPAMSLDDLATLVTASGILDQHDLVQLYTYIGRRDQKEKEKAKEKEKGKEKEKEKEKDSEPEDVVIRFTTKKRAGPKDKWAFDMVHLSPTVTLSKQNLTARNSGTAHGYCLGTYEFVKGQHAWRVNRDSGATQWLMIGVSRYQAHTATSYSQNTVWGVSSNNLQYLAGASTYMSTNFLVGPLDVLLDCDQGTLTIINIANGHKHILNGLPKFTPLVPHFSLHSNQQITVKIITPREVGKK